MRPWLAFLLVACVRRIPADPLPDAPPSVEAPDYATPELASASPYARAALANLQAGAAAQGIVLAGDDRLSRVAERLAYEVATRGRLPSSAAIQAIAADAGTPYVVAAVAVDSRPRRRPIREDLFAAVRDRVPGGPLPLVAGVGAWERERDTVLAIVLTRRAFRLASPVAREGAAVVPLVAELEAGAFALLAVDAEGVHQTQAARGEGGTAAPAVPVRDGWVELLALEGDRSSTLGLLRLGVPPALPTPSVTEGTAALAEGVALLREAWGLPPLRVVSGAPDCAVVPDVVDGIEVTRDQVCVALPVFGGEDPWSAVVQRPLLLRALADPRAELVQLAVDPAANGLALRTMRRFERLTAEAAADRLAAEIEARWPGARRDPDDDAFLRVVEAWAAADDPLGTVEQWSLRGDDVAQRWAKGPWVRVLAAAQEIPRLLEAADPALRPRAYAVAVAPGQGPNGEPMYYGIVGFRLPE